MAATRGAPHKSLHHKDLKAGRGSGTPSNVGQGWERRDGPQGPSWGEGRTPLFLPAIRSRREVGRGPSRGNEGRFCAPRGDEGRDSPPCDKEDRSPVLKQGRSRSPPARYRAPRRPPARPPPPFGIAAMAVAAAAARPPRPQPRPGSGSRPAPLLSARPGPATREAPSRGCPAPAAPPLIHSAERGRTSHRTAAFLLCPR